jgi:hypothetical protein
MKAMQCPVSAIATLLGIRSMPASGGEFTFALATE